MPNFALNPQKSHHYLIPFKFDQRG